MTDFLLNIGHNLALLLGLVLLSFLFRRELSHARLISRTVIGVLFGLGAIYCMVFAFVYKPGVIFDARTIVLMLGSLFGGVIVGSISSIIAALYRASLAGPGALTGVATILMACLAGFAGRSYLKRHAWPPSFWQVVCVGFFGHILVLACMLLLPELIRWQTIKSLAIPFLLVYPLVLAAFALIIIREGVWLSKISQLHHVDRLFHEAQQLTRFGSWEYLPESGQLLATQTFHDLLGINLPNQNLILDNLFELIDENDRGRFEAAFNLAVGSGKEFDIEGRLRSRDGRDLWVRLAAKPVSAGFETTRLIGNLFDITWRKSSELELRASQDRLQAILDHTLALICICDLEGKVTLANRRFEVFGMQPEELLGQPLFEFLPRAGALERWIDDYNSLMSGERVEFEEVLWHADGSVHTYLTSKFLLAPTADRPQSIGYVASDISDLRQTIAERKLLADELKIKNDELERFAYTVSHDLKGPLLTIKSFSDLLDNDYIEPSQKSSEFIQYIRAAADKMSRMIESLLELSRVGKALGEKEAVDLGKVTDDALLLLDGERRKSQALVTRSSDLPTVKGDYLRLVQVIQNLLQNAFKYANPAHPLEIDIDSVQQEDGDQVVFIKDNGVGLRPEQAEKIFEIFVHGDGPGTGIGLALVRRVMEVHGGSVRVESAGPGQGCTFFLRFPPPVEP